MKNLKSSGVIARIGGKRFGHWEVCDEINAEIAAAAGIPYQTYVNVLLDNAASA